MRILIIADPKVSVPPQFYGGAERIVALYANEFSRLGHQVDLIAGNGSKSFGGVLHLHSAPSKRLISRAFCKIRFQLQSIIAARNCDVVYNFGRFDYLESLLAMRKPLLSCFQNPVTQEEIEFAQSRIRSATAFHFISSDQRSRVNSSVPSFVFHNIIETRQYSIGDGSSGYLAFLGRLTFNKGVDVAIAVARRTGLKLVIAGNISQEPGGEKFFREEVKPFIDGDQISWIGPVNDEQKQQLLSGASALLFPIRWDEPFGIVMIEAMACGCPVIATRRASAPEVIDHGVNGWLCEPEEPSVEAFADAVKRVHLLDRVECRQAVEQRFDVRVMAPRVLDVLQKLKMSARIN